MNKPYYDKLGKLMIDSWSKFWPEETELIVYQEEFEIEKVDRVTGISWEDNCLVDWTEFSKKIKGPAAVFAKKGYSMIAGMKNIDCDLLIWLDADLISWKEFPVDKVLSILPDNKLIAFFDTYYQFNPNYTHEEYLNKSRIFSAAESGFVVINKNHKNFKEYASEYERLYNSKDRPPEVGEWFDGNICSSAALDYRTEIVDLSLLRSTNKSQTPINRSWIFEYCYHAKAKQKNGIDLSEFRNRLGL
jgi:hypothetical protein